MPVESAPPLSLVLDEHPQYLSDPVRLGAFGRAIRQVVRPGAVVVDLGSGTRGYGRTCSPRHTPAAGCPGSRTIQRSVE